MTEADRYNQAWQERRSRIFALIAVVLVFTMSLRYWPHPLLVAGSAVGILVAVYRIYQFACPRCRERFMPSPAVDLNFWSRKYCQNCNLEQGTIPGATRP